MRSILDKRKKRAAMELSMTTIIVVVLSITLLILGFILVRSIMCGAIDIVVKTDEQAKSELDKLYSSTADEYHCIGESERNPYAYIAGERNFVYCSIRAPSTAKYKFEIDVNYGASTISKEKLKVWFHDREFNQNIVPGKDEERKIADLDIPKNAPEGTMVFDVEVFRDNDPIGSAQLDYKVSRQGVISGFIC